MKLVWRAQARLDLKEIYRYVAGDNPAAAGKLRNRIRECALKLEIFPGIGRPGRLASTRELSISGTSYIIPYMIKNRTIHVLRVYHAARLWPENFDS